MPSHLPTAAISRRVAETVGRSIGAPNSSAIIERILTSLRESESAIPFSKARARPSQSRKVPLFSTTAATGRTTSAIAVTELWEISSDTTKEFSNCESAWLEISAGSTPPITTASSALTSSLARFNASKISEVERPGVIGSEGTDHAV